MVNLLKLSQDPRTWAPSQCLGEVLMKQGRKGSSKTLVWPSLCKHQPPGKLLVSAGILSGAGAASPNKRREKPLWMRGTEVVVAVVLQVNNPAVSAFLEAKGSVLQVIQLCLPAGENRILVAPTWLWNTIPECPVLHFCPKESRICQQLTVFKTLTQPRGKKLNRPHKKGRQIAEDLAPMGN